ncbi:hypothetical protein FOD75_11025 (plasmid) [Limosilactobacillus reuteri]|uniref:Uncharacterized protein n=2 Tax=Limosilactobacillus reuteri TaxID=1598 RepID=A0A517D8E3_LIMRT|nr:hypothetical protein FOD75_11025 [Limosilactobacillus reuteri]
MQTSPKWHYITKASVERYLALYPYWQKDKYYAICPYCHNPIVITQRGNSRSSHATTLFGKHVSYTPKGFNNVNVDKVKHCFLSGQSSLITSDVLKDNHFNSHELNVKRVRQALSYLTGVRFSNKLTWALIYNGKDAFNYRGIDNYNFPFGLLVVANSIGLTGRLIANPRLEAKIKDNSQFLHLVGHQLKPLSVFPNARMKLILGNDEINQRSGFHFLIAQMVETNHEVQRVVCTYHVVCKMFDELVYK